MKCTVRKNEGERAPPAAWSLTNAAIFAGEFKARVAARQGTVMPPTSPIVFVGDDVSIRESLEAFYGRLLVSKDI